ncbi:hypothetical protein CEXT_7381 [Caerostris extrusa]|uniref:Uncharacterized protein n=1 Tax=Caerostris extrusa TaxID=172846 RepID=A0AAV4Y6Y2_CAEEX|nr:hypothetical protein CEXT_7381 [Caerostris extrusa]
MFRLKKNKNIVCTLQDREINTTSPYKLSLNILSQLIRSNNRSFKQSWSKESPKPIVYDCGLLYFDNQRHCYNIFGSKGQPSLTKLKDDSNSKKIVDRISYSFPVIKTECSCNRHPCICLSRYILYVTDDNWLIQRNPFTGVIYKKVYVKRSDGFNFNFKYIDWNVYAQEFVLTTKLNPFFEVTGKKDVVVNLAVFTIFPLQFKALLEIRRSVFGKTCRHVNVSDQLLILGMGSTRVHIYSFDATLANSTIYEFNLGDDYNYGKVGMHPCGLPLNCIIHSAPPLLFNVESYGQSVNFGGFPYKCIYPCPRNHFRFIIQQLREGATQSCYVQSNVWNDEPNIVFFHPDNSNRIISKEATSVRCFHVVNFAGELKMKEIYSMGFPPNPIRNIDEFSSFGRRINTVENFNHLLTEKSIFALDYDEDLDIFAILGTRPGDDLYAGFIKIFDSMTGKEIKNIHLRECLCETDYYELHIELDTLVLIEKDERSHFKIVVDAKN